MSHLPTGKKTRPAAARTKRANKKPAETSGGLVLVHSLGIDSDEGKCRNDDDVSMDGDKLNI